MDQGKARGKHRNRSENITVPLTRDPHHSLFRIRSWFLQFYTTHDISLHFSLVPSKLVHGLQSGDITNVGGRQTDQNDNTLPMWEKHLLILLPGWDLCLSVTHQIWDSRLVWIPRLSPAVLSRQLSPSLHSASDFSALKQALCTSVNFTRSAALVWNFNLKI